MTSSVVARKRRASLRPPIAMKLRRLALIAVRKQLPVYSDGSKKGSFNGDYAQRLRSYTVSRSVSLGLVLASVWTRKLERLVMVAYSCSLEYTFPGTFGQHHPAYSARNVRVKGSVQLPVTRQRGE